MALNLGKYEMWQEKANYFKGAMKMDISVNDILERKCNHIDRKEGYDILDFALKRDIDFGWALADGGYPVFWG